MPTMNRTLSAGSWCLLALALAACDTEEAAKKGVVSGRSAVIVRGDRVVVEQTASEFFEARVLEVQDQTLRVQKVDGELARVSAGDVYAVRGAAQGARFLEPGALAICRARPSEWAGCRIDSVSPLGVVAYDEAGGRLSLETGQVIAPTAVTKLNLERRFGLVRKKAEFEAAVRRAGPPRPPVDYRPTVHEKVVAQHGGDWFSARIREIRNDVIGVAWDADGRISEVPRGVVVPQPGPESTLQRGSYGLLRPAGPAQPWQPIRVVASSGEEFIVVDPQGHRRRVHPRDVLSLGAR